MKTRTGGAVSIMNQYDTCQLVQKWFLVCWVCPSYQEQEGVVLLVHFLSPHGNNGWVSRRHRGKGNDDHDRDGKFGEKGFCGTDERD